MAYLTSEFKLQVSKYIYKSGLEFQWKISTVITLWNPVKHYQWFL